MPKDEDANCGPSSRIFVFNHSSLRDEARAKYGWTEWPSDKYQSPTIGEIEWTIVEQYAAIGQDQDLTRMEVM